MKGNLFGEVNLKQFIFPLFLFLFFLFLLLLFIFSARKWSMFKRDRRMQKLNILEKIELIRSLRTDGRVWDPEYSEPWRP